MEHTAAARVRRLLTTPPVLPDRGPRLKTNLDTSFLKLVALLSMVLDHAGSAFFPGVPAFRWAGRLAFPLYCYCMTVGLLYTRDVRRYLLRLGLFAVVSQPFYVLAFHPPAAFWAQFTNWNIFFTLFLSLLAMEGLRSRRWWLFLLGAFTVSWWNFNYSGMGIQLMLIFYLCRNHPAWGALLYCLTYATGLFTASPADPRNLLLGPVTVDWTCFALLAAPLIFLRTNTGLRVNRWVFYLAYPAHLAAIALLRLLLS